MLKLNLRLFDLNTNVTTQASLSPEMKTYYDKRLIDNAEPELVHDQFGQQKPIPRNGGKTIEFRKYSALPKALTPLTEGVTPNGRSLTVTALTSTVSQYGDYITISDVLDLTAIDRNMDEATTLLGAQAGRTLDTVTREVLAAGTNKMFAPTISGSSETPVVARASINTTAVLTPKLVRLAANKLARMNVPKINGYYICIAHPDTMTDLMGSSEWVEAQKYVHPEKIYQGEVGELYGVKFVQSTEAKIIGPSAIAGVDNLFRTTVQANVSNSTTVKLSDVFDTTTATAVNAAISAGAVYKVYIDGTEKTIASVTGGAAGTCAIVVDSAITVSSGKAVVGYGAGSDGSAVYCSIFLGANAYGVTEIEGGGLEFIVKQLGSAGTGDPLNQRATTGWKALKTAEILLQENMLRVEHSTACNGAIAVSN